MEDESKRVYEFGPYCLDRSERLLLRDGLPVPLAPKSLDLLLVLVERHGHLIEKDRLLQLLWPDTVVEEANLSYNVSVLRKALGDGENGRMIETVPKRGYRFVGAVREHEAGAPRPAETPAEALGLGVAEMTPARETRWRFWIVAGALVLLCMIGAGLWRWSLAAFPELQVRRLTNDTLKKIPPVVSDGSRLYFVTLDIPDYHIVQLPLSGGEPARLSLSLPGKDLALLDVTPDGQELLVRTFNPPGDSTSARWPLWKVRIPDGSIRRLGSVTAWEARYSPDGKRIVFVSNDATSVSLSVASSDGSNPQELLKLKGMGIVDVYWSPDGDRIAFGERNLSNQFGGQPGNAPQENAAWEIRADGTHLRRLFPDWHRNHRPAGWAEDGQILLIRSEYQLWGARLLGRWFPGGESHIFRLTPGEPQIEFQVASRDNRTFYAVGTTPLGELQRFDSKTKSWVPHLGGISADTVEYSRDGRQVVYITHPNGELMVRLADGSRPIRLTNPPLAAFRPRWSPDGGLLAFLGRTGSEEPWRIYLVDSDGGTPRLACAKNSDPVNDLSWTPDGKNIIYDARGSYYYPGLEPYLRVLNLATCEVSKFPGSERLVRPRWSPDGSALAAVEDRGNSTRVMLYHVSSGKWEELVRAPSAIHPAWSHDGRSLWYCRFGSLVRCDIARNRNEEVARARPEEFTGLVGSFFGLTANDEPMMLRRRDVQQVYAFELKAH